MLSQKDKRRKDNLGCWAINQTHGHEAVQSPTQNTDFYRVSVLAEFHWTPAYNMQLC